MLGWGLGSISGGPFCRGPVGGQEAPGPTIWMGSRLGSISEDLGQHGPLPILTCDLGRRGAGEATVGLLRLSKVKGLPGLGLIFTLGARRGFPHPASEGGGVSSRRTCIMTQGAAAARAVGRWGGCELDATHGNLGYTLGWIPRLKHFFQIASRLGPPEAPLAPNHCQPRRLGVEEVGSALGKLPPVPSGCLLFPSHSNLLLQGPGQARGDHVPLWDPISHPHSPEIMKSQPLGSGQAGLLGGGV